MDVNCLVSFTAFHLSPAIKWSAWWIVTLQGFPPRGAPEHYQTKCKISCDWVHLTEPWTSEPEPVAVGSSFLPLEMLLCWFSQEMAALTLASSLSFHPLSLTLLSLAVCFCPAVTPFGTGPQLKHQFDIQGNTQRLWWEDEYPLHLHAEHNAEASQLQ